jgi:hypothetical protein
LKLMVASSESELPQFAQKCAPSGFRCPQLVQNTLSLPMTSFYS